MTDPRPNQHTAGGGATREVLEALDGAVGLAAGVDARRAVAGVTLLVLSVLFVPLGLAFLIASGVLFYGVFVGLLQIPSGTLSGGFAAGWWVGTIVVMFLLFRKVYRWLRNRSGMVGKVVEFGLGERPGHPRSSQVARDVGRPEEPGAHAIPAPSLAELDARLAPTTLPAPPSPPTG